MSIIFGIRTVEEQAVDEQRLCHLALGTARYAREGAFVRSAGCVGMGIQPYRTHLRSRLESKPFIDERGNMIALDGRIDNHVELSRLLGLGTQESSDSEIVLAAFRCWGEGCFSKLVGDWALALWTRADRSLYLARDHAGTRTLYFEHAAGRTLWSTYLETFFVEDACRDLNEEFAACYLTCRPLRDLTPYQGIRAIPPAHFVRFRGDTMVRQSHWEWMASEELCYETDSEYEEQFRTLFRQSVDRRSGPGAPVLAHLSGGMDSTSIVCVSDGIRLSDNGRKPDCLIDTLSLYNDLESSWNERPYFSLVEDRRGKAGIHIDTSKAGPTFEPLISPHGPSLLPGCDSETVTRDLAMEKQLGREYRAVLSGIGGDEILGGVPQPLPELADLLARGDLGAFLSRSIEWCLAERSPLWYMVARTFRYTLGLYLRPRIHGGPLPVWIQPRVRELAGSAHGDWVARSVSHTLRPSAIDNGMTWWSILESMPQLFPSLVARPEYRFPYLDRDLVDFLFRVPRRKLVNPGRRRTLMRNALKGIVPEEILERKRKAYVIRKPLSSLRHAHEKLGRLFSDSQLAARGLIGQSALQTALDHVAEGNALRDWPALMRSISLELWLRSKPSAVHS
jgi:asparagine synthase (glutamine-hydrolysing)